MDKFVFALFLLGALCCCSNAVRLDRCGITRALRAQGFPEDKMSDWVCLVENESGGNTGRKSRQNKNGSYDYGLFQINDKYWCSASSTPGKDCNVTCADLLTDDITKASQCAKKVFKRHGFMAWYGWRNHCQNKPLPDISKC
ncbi:unnamed protein product [Chilo suppressalis]|uniref:Lysozyme n=1 Tax=Chilo suppressalis TaxID=168631 RepID=A0ABN8BBY9_CHISP|nr:hypothetical protein evm_006652 [Chilo suppressalis]CAH0406842.1 unnamed protein product [Chilo suppressalis]